MPSFRKTITYFDLGVWDGQEIDAFIEIAKELNLDYRVIGFEPDIDLFYKLFLKYKNNKSVQIFNVAISDCVTILNLYKSESTEYHGNSIFKGKNNVNINEYDSIISIPLSEVIMPWNLGDINIVRFNIEGAELYLMQDLIKNDKVKLINIFCGSTPDIHKVSEIKDLEGYYNQLLIDNNINVSKFHFAYDLAGRLDMKNNLKNKIMSFIDTEVNI